MEGHELSPCAFLFVSPMPGEDHGESLDEAFLNALKIADPQRVVESRIYRGGILLAQLSYKPSIVKVETDRYKNRLGAVAFESSQAKRSDRDLYAVLVGDFVETCLAQWNTLRKREFWKHVANRAIDATFTPTLPSSVVESMDDVLRAHPRYIGAVSPDLGNPLHRYLFVDALFKDAFIRDGRVFVEGGGAGGFDGAFFGADTFSPLGKEVLSCEEFENSVPPIQVPDALSSRGLVTEIRMRRRMALDIHERLMDALLCGRTLDGVKRQFEWDLSQLPDSPEEIKVQSEKLTNYLLEPQHEKGKSKAKFFEEKLAITRKDWTYLHSQLLDGLRSVPYENVMLDEHGVRFSADIAVLGMNGDTAVIKTVWIVRQGERASFVTAYPVKKNTERERNPSPPPVVSGALKGEERWQEIYDVALKIAREAMSECVPKPLVVEYAVYMEGECGGARIVINDGRASFVHWLRKKGLGQRNYPSGYAISAEQRSQSAEEAKAYADAFARVLLRNGIKCRSEIYYT